MVNLLCLPVKIRHFFLATHREYFKGCWTIIIINENSWKQIIMLLTSFQGITFEIAISSNCLNKKSTDSQKPLPKDLYFFVSSIVSRQIEEIKILKFWQKIENNIIHTHLYEENKKTKKSVNWSLSAWSISVWNANYHNLFIFHFRNVKHYSFIK